ncbi:MAG: hypothetical protein IKH97_04545 [Bacteroidales bacterium]|nr:hypothetical protein [Bacteroidales bacterium]
MLEVNKPFTITPHKGYLNTIFRIREFPSERVQILIDGKPIDIAKDIHLCAGEHIVSCNYKDHVYSDTVFVEDAIRLGGSQIVSGFCFDNNPWNVIVMKDRTYFFNSKTGEQFVENGVSPINVTALNENLLLFANGERKEVVDRSSNDVITEYSIFSCNQDCILGFYSKEVFHNDDVAVFENAKDDTKEKLMKIIYYERPNTPKEISCVDYKILPDGINYCSIKNGGFCIKQYSFETEEEKDLYTSNGRFVCFQSDSLVVVIDSNDHTMVKIVDVQSNQTIPLKYNNRACVREVNGMEINDSDPVDLFYQHVKENWELAHTLAFQLHTVNIDLYNTAEGVYAKRTFHNYEEKSTNDWINKNKRVYPYYIRYDLVKLGSAEESIPLDQGDEILQTGEFLCIKKDNNVKIVSNGKVIRELNDVRLYKTPKGKYLYTKQTDNAVSVFLLGQTEDCKYIENNTSVDCSKLESFGILKFHNSTGEDIFYNKGYYILFVDKSSGRAAVGDKLKNNTTIVEKNGRCFGKDSDDDGQEYYISTTLENIFGNHLIPIPVGHSDILCMTATGSSILAKSNRGGVVLYEKQNEYSDYVVNEALRDVIDTDVYRSALFSDDGQHLVSLKNGGWVYRDIKSGKEIPFPMDKTIEKRYNVGLYGMNCYVRYDDIKRRIDVVDPFSLNLVRPGSLNNYVFISPSGNYAADTNREIVKRYYLKRGHDEYKKEIGGYLSEEEKKNDWTFDGIERGSKEIENKIIQRVLPLLNDNFRNTYGFYLHEEWTSKVIVHRLNDNKSKIELEFPDFIFFLNYVAFSPDDRYVSVCGKYGNRRTWTDGFVGVYDLEKREWALKPDPVYLAIWKAFFNSHGIFAYYNSEPTTIYGNLENSDGFEKIDGRNLLTFSRTGKYIAMSDTHYTPYCRYPESWGHMHSSNIYIRSLENPERELHFSDHGAEIQGVKTQYTTGVSFSPDDSKLLSVSNDGVVIIRNIHLDELSKARYDIDSSPIEEKKTATIRVAQK